MSHLIHVIALKNKLAEWGATDVQVQAPVISEAFVRAITRNCFTNDTQWTDALGKRAWFMLEKWNAVFPIPASAIHATAHKRANEVRGQLANTGTVCGCSWKAIVRMGPKGEDVDVGEWEEFKELVTFLTQEMVNCHDYFQLVEPSNSYVPGENKQKIDLNEYYRETDQEGKTVVVQGVEELSLGKLSRRTALMLNLQGARNYDPFPSERNARMGAEGFLSTIAEGFKSFIETIIKYIRMAIDWVVDTVKAIFGFRKSARIDKAIDDSLEGMKKEFEETITRLGLDPKYYNVERYVGDLKQGQRRSLQLTMMRNKLEGDKESIEGLANSIPIMQNALVKIKKAGDLVVIKTKALKKTIADEYNRVRVHQKSADFSKSRSSMTSSEVNRVMTACQEVKLALDPKGIVESVGALYTALYGINFTSDQLENGFSEVRDKLKASIKAEEVKLSPHNASEIMTAIAYLNARYQEVNDNEIDLSKINWRELGNVVDKTDSQKVEAIASFFEFPNLTGEYQAMGVAVRNFTQYCFNVTQSLLIVEKQISNLVDWHRRCHAYYYSMVINDVETIEKVIKEARSKGLNPAADVFGLPNNLVFVKREDAETLAEKMAAHVNFMITEDIAGIKTSLNNFSKQIGWGSLV